VNKSFKIVGKYRAEDLQPSWCRGKPNTQAKKRVYTSEEDYNKYGKDTATRWRSYYDVTAYELIDGKWKEIDK
jgi:hypothetical protein